MLLLLCSEACRLLIVHRPHDPTSALTLTPAAACSVPPPPSGARELPAGWKSGASAKTLDGKELKVTYTR
jgi:hypothetical protein